MRGGKGTDPTTRNATQEGGGWSAPRFGRFTRGIRPGFNCTGDWVGLAAGLDGKEFRRGIPPHDRPACSESLFRLLPQYLRKDI